MGLKKQMNKNNITKQRKINVAVSKAHKIEQKANICVGSG